MTRYMGPAGIVIGMAVIVIGALLQANGAASVVFCSVIGGGIVLLVIGVAIWLVQALRHRRPGSLAA